jgi:AcrR family transcriptional regulator
MTEIATVAGITHSSIYQYFASKRELYQAAFESAQAELLPQYLEAIKTGATLKEQIKAIFRASARTHERKPTITPFLASIPIELRRHPDLLPTLQAESSQLMASLSDMFASARRRGEIPTGADDMDLLVGFIGAVMGIGLLSYGIQTGRMGTAVEMLLAALDGEFFADSVTPTG